MSSTRRALLVVPLALLTGCGRSGTAPVGPAPPSDAQPAQVQEVVDGDTIKVARGGVEVTVRMLGMDTPETHDPRKPVQCFGPDAAARAAALLTGRQVELAGDPSQDRHDRYGRELDYVWLPDGRLYDWLMIRDGYAHEYTYRSAYRYRALFRDAQQDARRDGRGLWSSRTCGGDTTQAARQ